MVRYDEDGYDFEGFEEETLNDCTCNDWPQAQNNSNQPRRMEGMEKPYLIEISETVIEKYNPNYGDLKICKCGHNYYRHFDSYNDMYPCGCKYCECYKFIEA